MKIFGEKIENLNYKNIPSVYAVILNDAKEKVLTVRNGKGHYFLPGGGLEENESHEEGIKRELLEENGYNISIDSYIGKAKMYFTSSNKEPLLNDGYFYSVNLLDKICEPVEDDHMMHWIPIDSVKDYLFHEHHAWAVQHYFK